MSLKDLHKACMITGMGLLILTLRGFSVGGPLMIFGLTLIVVPVLLKLMGEGGS